MAQTAETDNMMNIETISDASVSSSTTDSSLNSNNSIKLKRNLGLRNGIAIIIGIIIGSGIFVSPTGVLHDAGSVGMALMIWLLCGIATLLGGLCYAELGTSIPVSGGPYSYIYEAFGRLPAFLTLWISVLMRTPTGNAIMALTFANYVLYPVFPDCQPPHEAKVLLAAISICFLSFLNCASVDWAARLQDVFMFFKILALGIIIVAGMIPLFKGNTEHFEKPFESTTRDPGKISLAIYAGLFSFSGWDGFNFVTEEIRNPKRNLPLAIWISIPLCTIVYLLVNVAFFTVLDQHEILTSSAIAVTFSQKMLGVMSFLMPVFVAFSCFGSLNGSLLTGSRSFFVGARDGNLPSVMALVNVKCLTPITSVIFGGIMSLIMISTGDVFELITYFEFVESLLLGAPVLGLLYLRWKKPDMPRPVKVHIIIPIMYLVVVTFLLLFPWLESPVETMWGVVMILSGLPIYLIFISWNFKPKCVEKFVYNITKYTQLIFYCVPQEGYEEKLA
ncbi:Y+L amino acid transporter 2-like [Tubulanus polymorphus]|uniref:Y+L amino acid transporter 2-like n=1 Tax=Tubulanus polymorphus TaxID=672921 RepID=UPI003DA3FE6D